MRRRKKRRSPASEEDSVDVHLLSAMSNKIDFVDECVYISGNRIFLTRVGVEVAVGATVFAERDVDVERGVRGHVRGVRFFLGSPIGPCEQAPRGGSSPKGMSLPNKAEKLSRDIFGEKDFKKTLS